MFSASKTAAPVSGSFQVSNSLRFRASASAYLNRTPSVAGNRTTWTWSGWVKRGNLTDTNGLMQCGPDGSNQFRLLIDSLGPIYIYDLVGGSYSTNLGTTQVFRDPSAWYHFVLAYDTTQATASNRVRFYVNGIQVTAFSGATYPSQNYASGNVNSVASTKIGRGDQSSTYYFDGYMAEVNFIDGQALTPSSFGSINATTGVWQPARYTGSYGTNGFYLKFNNGTSTTTLGNDSSGNNNNWTTNNISLTAGSTYDWMIDSPTSYAGSSYGVGNYAVLNPLKNYNNTIVDGNLNISSTSASTTTIVLATIGMSTGKWYWEFTQTSFTVINSPMIGVAKDNVSMTAYVGSDANGWGYYGTGDKYNNAVGTAYGATYTNNDVIGVAFDATAGTLVFYKNNSSQGTAFTGLTSGPYFPAFSDGGSTAVMTANVNFGQRPFAYTPPTGFKSLCTQNLPAPAIVKGSAHMNAVLDNGYAGVLTANGTIATGTTPYYICISNDGTSVYVANQGSNTISLYQRNTTTGALTANGTIATDLDPRGICISNDGTSVYATNRVSNTVSIYTRNTTTGALTANGTIATGLDPRGICISNDGTSVYANNLGSNTVGIYTRNTTTGALTSGGTIATGTSPVGICISNDGTSVYSTNYTSNTVSIYTRNTTTGALTANGTIATGTNPFYICISNDGTSVYVANSTSSTVSLYQRNTTTGALTSNSTIATGTTPWGICISNDGTSVYVANSTANTVSIYTRNTTTGALTSNSTIATGTTPYYICISNDGTSVYAANFGSNTVSLYQRATTDIKTTSQALYTYYLEWIKDRANVNNHQLADTVRGNTAILQSNTTAAETTYTAPSGNSVGWVWNANAAAVSNTSGTIPSSVSANTTAGFSVVTYTGSNVTSTVGHGLGVAPSFIIAKIRTTTDVWVCYHASLGKDSYLILNQTDAAGTLANYWGVSAPTSSVYGVTGSGGVGYNNNRGNVVAYCFAAIAGYSAFGSYTGNGSADGPFVYTGFRPRFVLIKITSASTDGWILQDTTRFPYNVITQILSPSNSGAESTFGTQFSIDMLSNGFKIRNSGSWQNGSGSTYIYAAFAENPFQNSLAF